MITVPVVQVTLAIIVGLFALQMIKRLTATSQNPIAMGVTDGIAFLTS